MGFLDFQYTKELDMTTDEFRKEMHYIVNHKCSDEVKKVALRALAHVAGRQLEKRSESTF